MFQTRRERMLESGNGDPTQFGEIPDRNTLHQLKHQAIINNENFSESRQPRAIWGAIALLLGLSAVEETNAKLQRQTAKLQGQIEALGNGQQTEETIAQAQATTAEPQRQATPTDLYEARDRALRYHRHDEADRLNRMIRSRSRWH